MYNIIISIEQPDTEDAWKIGMLDISLEECGLFAKNIGLITNDIIKSNKSMAFLNFKDEMQNTLKDAGLKLTIKSNRDA